VLAGRRVKLAALAAGATMLLAGCGMHPGAAAVVESQTISHDQVDDVALAVCSANLAAAQMSNQPPPTIATRESREVALGILIDTELSHQYGEREGIEPNPREVSQAVAQNEAGLDMLPADRREVFRTTLRDYAAGQLILIEAGRADIGDEATEEEAINRGVELRQEYVDTIDVDVDPRYGRFEDGRFQRGGAALSVPASDDAVVGDQDRPGDGFVGRLPASQQCS
jgi:hypothetical protein